MFLETTAAISVPLYQSVTCLAYKKIVLFWIRILMLWNYFYQVDNEYFGKAKTVYLTRYQQR